MAKDRRAMWWAAAMIAGVSAAGCGGGETACAECIDIAFDLPEGGEVHLELTRVADSEGVVSQVPSAYAVVFDGQDPPRRLMTEDHVAEGGCIDYRSHDRFATGGSAEVQAIADTRDYADLGDSVSLSASAGTISLARATAVVAGGIEHDIAYQGGADLALASGRYVLDTLPGTDAYPDWDLRRGLDMNGAAVSGEPAVFVPSDLTLAEPSEAAFFAGVTLAPGQDATFTWTDGDATPAGAPPELTFVALSGTAGVVDYYCLVPAGDHSVTIPAAIVDAADATGSLVLGTLSESAWDQGNRAYARLDLVGIASRSTTYTVGN